MNALPMLRILPPVVLGILLGEWLRVEAWVLWAALGVCYLCAWLTIRQSVAGWIYAFVSLMLTAAALTVTLAPRAVLPEGERIAVHLRVTDSPAVKGRWQNTTARAGFWRDSVWHPADEGIILSVDTCYKIAVGEEMVCMGYVNRLDSSGYANLMHARGFTARMYVTRGNLPARAPEVDLTPRVAAKRMQAAALERLSRLGLEPDEAAVAATMAAGERRDMPPGLREAYARVGASHLLAVSGLHVGIVFVLINCLLWLLPVFRRGHIAKNIIAIAAIWAYAAMTGLSPSVMRSALMFTGAQAALAATLHRSSLNILLGTAVVMLLFWPGNLHDVSFQLSMAAVLAIVIAYKPLYDRMKTRNRLINAFASVFIVGLVATLGTAPLVAYHFGNFPLIGIFVNPPLILTAHVIVLLAGVWIIFPAGFCTGIAKWLLGGAVWLQNRIVEGSAALPGAAVGVRLTLEEMLLVYMAYIVLIVWISTRERKKEELVLA